jgi:hypothetical protein
MSAGLVLLFFGSFTYFHHKFQTGEEKDPLNFPSSFLNKPLPMLHLVDVTGGELSYSELQKGKVVLVLVTEGCHRCLEEANFIGGVLNLRDDVRFYGVIPFGADRSVLKSAVGKFPFKTFFDEGAVLQDAFRLDKVPLKLYLENGIIKKGWGGATYNEVKEAEFKHWLESV